MTARVKEDEEATAIQGGVLANLVGYHLRRASGVFGNDFSQIMEGTGLRQVLFGILSIVEANPGVGQGAAGRVLGIQRANMVSLINELVDKGLIARQVDGKDRRAFALNITDAGRKALAGGLKRIELHEDRLLSNLTAKQRRLLIALLDLIILPLSHPST